MRKVLKYLMLLLLIFLCGSGLGTSNVESLIHEWAGILLFLLVLIHLIQNRKWFKTLIKGKYNDNRLITTIIDLTLIILLILIAISSLVISRFIFKNINIIDVLLARRIHLALTAWLFIICSIHYGMHLHLDKKYNIFNWIIIIIGLVSCIYTRFYERLFLINEFPYMPFEESWKLYILNLFICLSFVLLGIECNKFMKKIKKKDK